jgi:hypothetical protein
MTSEDQKRGQNPNQPEKLFQSTGLRCFAASASNSAQFGGHKPAITANAYRRRSGHQSLCALFQRSGANNRSQAPMIADLGRIRFDSAKAYPRKDWAAAAVSVKQFRCRSNPSLRNAVIEPFGREGVRSSNTHGSTLPRISALDHWRFLGYNILNMLFTQRPLAASYSFRCRESLSSPGAISSGHDPPFVFVKKG